MTEYCPCGSGENQARCCGPLLGGEKPAPTAGALMRSRYTAYALSQVAYLEKTLLPRKRATFHARETLDWNADVSWTGLRILATSGGAAGDEDGVVEFIASYVKAGEPHDIHEISRFKKKGGSWFYVDGVPGGAAGEDGAASPGVVAPKPKAGRNEPCPCGSGKKFKRCCG